MKVRNLVQCIGLFSTSEDESKPNLEALVPKGFFDDCEKEKLALAKSIAFDNDFVVCEPDLPKTNHFSFQSRTGKTFFGTSLRFHETSLRGDNYLCRFLFVMTTTNQFYFSEMLSKLVFLSCVVDRLPEPLLFEHLFVSLPRTSPSQSQIMNLKFFKKCPPVPLLSPCSLSPPVFNPSFVQFFDAFGSLDVAYCICALLCEKRVILLSDDTNQLAPLMECLLDLIYPFKWCHFFSSNVTKKTYEKLNSRKTPFFVGVLKDEIYNLGLETGIKDAIVIDLDTEIRIDGYEEKLFCPILFEKKVAAWYRKALRCFPCKKGNKAIFENVLELSFGEREPFFEIDIENKEKSEKFFENIDKSTMRKRFLRSMNINSENLANGKIRSQLHQKLKNFYAGLYENQKVATNEMLKAMPNFNLDKISEQTQENIFDLKNVTSGLEEKIESKIEKIKMVDFFEDAKYSRDDLTHEAKDFLKLIYGDFGGPGKNGLSEKEIDEWSATEDMSFGEEMDSSVEGENVMSEISGERNDREETEDEFFTTKMDKDLKERMVRDLKERNKNVQGCENRAVFSDYDTGILIARKSVEDK